MATRLCMHAGFVVLLFAIVFETGCAKIADPQPPDIRIPKPASDLSVQQLSDYVILSVSKPIQNTDGTEATTLAAMDLLRLAEEAQEWDPRQPLSDEQFLSRAVRVLSIPASRFPNYLKDGVFFIEDRLTATANGKPFARGYRYAVLFFNESDQTAGLSNQASIRMIPIPPAPEGLSAELTETAVKLSWTVPAANTDGSKPARIAGYNLYRSASPDGVPDQPVNSVPLQEPGFEDRSFSFDKTYYYSVSTVGNLENPHARSLPSDFLKVQTRDTFPPAPPEEFSAILDGETVLLLWVPSPSRDVAGYVIHRQEKGTQSQIRLNPEFIRTPSYRDRVDPKKEYQYSIRAVDTHGNESVPVLALFEKR